MAIETGKQARLLVSINPATKEKLGETAATEPAEIELIVRGAKKAQKIWKKKSIAERLKLIKEFRRLLSHGQDAVSKLITNEAGKPFTEAMVSEVFAVLETCQWLENKAESILKDESVELNQIFFTGKRSYNHFEPLGVIAVISPWNYPFSIPATSMLMALCAGNAVVLKPSPKTALTAAALVELFYKAGFPKELIGLVQGENKECERLILAGVNRVVFTGSVSGGRAIMSIASQKLVPLTLELGGKHAAIVLPDVDPEAAASGIVWSAFTNGGQACASIDRLYLVKPLNPKLLEKTVEIASKLRLGDGMNADTDVGPLIDEEQLQRMKDLLADATEKGAEILCGGKSREDLGGYFFEPAVIGGLKPEMRISKEEIFGPFLPVYEFDSAEEAIQAANASELGLAASVWTADLGRGTELAEELEAGVVWVNEGLYSHVCPDAPWGGIKESGFGKAHSKYELLDLVSVKNLGLSSEGIRDWHYPYSQNARDYVKAGIDLLHKASVSDRLQALLRVLSLKSKLRK